jgi:hypothetical protein
MKTSWLLITGVAAIWMSGEVASAQTLSPTVVYPEQVAISGPLSQGQGGDDHGNKKQKAREFHPIPHRGGGGPDDIQQTTGGPPLNTDAAFNFPGIGATIYAPPDPNMAVGPNHILQTVNSRYAIYNKSGTLITGPFDLSSIWASLGSGNSCASSNDGDVVAQYDKFADRFVITQLGSISAPYSECIAVSQTSDPAGAYWLYSYGFGNQLNDYPKFGIWPTATNSAYLATYNFFADAQTFTGGGLCAYDRAKMLEGDPTAQGICYTVNGDGGYLPADLDGSIPVLDGTPAYFLNYETTSSLRMYALSPNFSNPSASTLATAGPDIPVATFSEACAPTYTSCIPQQGTSQRLDSLGDRLMYRLAFRNFADHEAMIVNHSVASGSRVGVRWYELRSPVSVSGQFSLYQEGTYAPDTTTYRWMGSAAMDSAGDIGLGYSASSGTMHPGIRYTGRMPNDPLGTMESEVTLVTGNGSQTQGLSRWGDYSAMRIDPSDDCTFWYTNEYLVSNGSYNWQTAFGSFKFASCHPPDISLSASPSSLTVAQTKSKFSTITVTALNGFNGSAGLTVNGCPANATCTVSNTPVFPNPTATSVLDVVTTTSTGVGTYTLTIIGTTAGSVVSTSVLLTVTPPPDFSISVNPSSLTVVQVGNATPAVTVTALYGFTGSVDLAVTGCPSGAMCTLPAPVSPTATSTLTVALSTATGTGTYTLTITGTQGALIHTATLTLTVVPAGSILTNVALAANGGVAVASSTYNSADAAADAIDGDRKSDVFWNDATPNSFPDWLEVDFNGTKMLSEVDVFSVQDNLQSPVNPIPTMTFTLYGLTNFEVQYWTGSAWTDIPGGLVTNNNLVWRQFKFAPLSTTKIRVFISGTADGVWSRIAEVEAYAIPNSPDFAVSASPSSLTLVQGETGISTVTAMAVNGFSGSVDLAVTGCPAGSTCTLPTPVSPTAVSTLTITTSASTSTGTYTLTISGTQAAVVHTAAVSLTVNAPGTLTNVALAANGGTAVASSTYNSADAAADAIDGDRKSDVFWNDGTANTFPDWLEVDFNGTKAISEVDVFSVQDNLQSPVNPTPTMTFTLYGLTNFEVQYWTGSAWADIPGGMVTNNNLVWRQFIFAPLSTTKIRVFITGTKDGVWSRIAEVEAYATVSSAPDFLIAASPSSLSLVQAGSGTSNVTVTALNGLSGNVDLAATGCPSGAICTLPTPVSPTATSTLTVALSTATSTGTYTVTITGTQGALIRTATLTLTVIPAGTLTNVALAANGGAAVASSTYNSADAAANAIDGDRKSDVFWNDATSNSFPDWLEVDFNGTKAISEVDVFSVQDNLQSPVNPTPTMTFTLYGLTNFEVQYWTGSAWTDIPGGLVTNNNLVWRQFKFAPLSTTKIRVFITGTADAWSRIAEVEAYAIPNSPDFSISASPSSLTLVQGETGTSSVTATAVNGFSGSVDLAVTGCPAGATCSLPTPVSPTAVSTLTITTSASTSTGTFTLTISGTQAAVVHTAAVSLTVNAPGTLTNVALPANGGAAVASSTYNSADAAANAIDGDRKSDVFWNDATANTFPDWLEVDFNGTKAISEVDVFSVQDNLQSPSDPTPTMTFTLYGLTNFEVQYWTGSVWADIPGGMVTNNNLVWRQFKFTPLPTTKIRVFITGTKDGVWSRIAEVEAYATVSSAPNFLISANPASLSLVQAATGTSDMTVTALNGFSGNVDLAVTGCPSGAICTLPTPVSPTATSTLTVALSTATSTGTYTLTITGTQGALIRTATLTLTVIPAGTLTNVALAANGGSAVASSTYNSADAAADAIDGDRKSDVFWNDATPNSFPDWLEVDFNGTKTLNEIDVFSVQDNLQTPVNPTPTMTFTLYGLTNFEVQYWTGSAWTDIPGGMVTNNNLVWRQFKFAPLSTTKIRVFITGTSDGWSRIAEVEAYAIPNSPDFSISASPSSLTLVQGATGTSSVTATAVNGFSGNVDLAVTGCPAGATCTLPTPVSPTAASTLTITTSASTSTGTYTLTISGTQAAVVHTATVSLTIILTNVALAANGGTAVASSTYNSADAAADAIDGDRKSDVFWNDGTANTFPDWLEVDFNGTKAISEVDVFSVQDNLQSPVNPTPTMTFTLYGLTNFEVQYWTGSAWADIPGGLVTNNNLVWRQFIFAPLSTTKIRVFITGTADGVWSRIAEVEAYAGQ